MITKHKCGRCGSEEIALRESSHVRVDGTKRQFYVCLACKRESNRRIRHEGVTVPTIDLSEIGWTDEQMQAWNNRARETLKRISSRFSS